MSPIVPAVLALALSVSPVAASSDAEQIATRTGEVIGAAAACSVPEVELIEVGRKIIAWARDTARDADDLRRAQEAHEAAVERGADRVKRAGNGACSGTVQAFKELKRESRPTF